LLKTYKNLYLPQRHRGTEKIFYC